MSSTSANPAGCDVCRQAVYSKGPELEQIAADPDEPLFLYRCRSCDTYWEFNIHDGHSISTAQAKQHFPQAFGSDTTPAVP